MVCAINSPETSEPSLYLSGRSTSNRRSALLIGGRSFHGEGNAFHGKRRQRAFRNEGFPVRPRLETESSGQEAERLSLHLRIGEMNSHHLEYLSPTWLIGCANATRHNRRFPTREVGRAVLRKLS